MARGDVRGSDSTRVPHSGAVNGALDVTDVTGSFAKTGAARSLLMKAALAMTGIGILTAAAYVSVPFYPVPLTMQTLAVLLLGGLLGPGVAASSVMGYIALGAMGAPVFSSGTGGIAVLAGPTAGYLVGFVPAAFLMGLAVRRARRRACEGRVCGVVDARGVGHAGGAAPIRGAIGSLSGWRSLGILALGAVAASMVIYAVGVPWLAVFTGQGLAGAAQIGLVPFLLGDALKAAVAIGAIRLGGDLLARRGLLPH